MRPISHGAGHAIVEHDARAKTGDVLVGWHAIDAHVVFTLDLVAGVLEPVRDVSIVGQKEQPFRVEVEPADVAEAGALGGQEVVDGAPAVGVLGGAQHPCGLVKTDPASVR